MNELAEVLHRRTGGHPLFLTTIVDELVARKSWRGRSRRIAGDDPQAIASVIPASVRQFIEHRFEQLSSEEQTILEASSVAGDPFSVAAVAAATSLPEETIEARCEAWARAGQFLTADGIVTWPDGTLAARYGFRHDLSARWSSAYLSGAARASTPASRQSSGKRLRETSGNDRRRARHALRPGARSRKSGVVPGATRQERAPALGVLRSGPASRPREKICEGAPRRPRAPPGGTRASFLLGQVLTATKGWGVEEVERIYHRAREICEDSETHTVFSRRRGD